MGKKKFNKGGQGQQPQQSQQQQQPQQSQQQPQHSRQQQPQLAQQPPQHQPQQHQRAQQQQRPQQWQQPFPQQLQQQPHQQAQQPPQQSQQWQHQPQQHQRAQQQRQQLPPQQSQQRPPQQAQQRPPQQAQQPSQQQRQQPQQHPQQHPQKKQQRFQKQQQQPPQQQQQQQQPPQQQQQQQPPQQQQQRQQTWQQQKSEQQQQQSLQQQQPRQQPWQQQKPEQQQQSFQQHQQRQQQWHHGSPEKQLTTLSLSDSQPSKSGRGDSDKRQPTGRQERGQGDGPKPAQQLRGSEQTPPSSDRKESQGKKKEGSPTDLIVPLRKQLQSGGTKGRAITIETNHLRLILKNLDAAIHYDVDIEPDKPKKFLRLVMEQFRRNNYPERYPAFDGVKNLYSSLPLPFNREIEGDVTISLDDKEKTYKVKVKFASKIDLKSLANYFGSTARGDNHMVTPQEAIQCLDIVLRNAPSLRCIPVGRSFFTRPGPRDIVDLGEGMEMYNGIYQSAVLGWKPFLNIDVAHKAFPKSMSVIDLIAEVCDRYYQISQPLVQYNYETVDRFIKTLKVIYQIPNQPNSRRIMRVNQLDRPANQARFKNEQGIEMTVADYFAKVKQTQLRYPHLPTLWVGSKQREPRILLPIEFCTIVDGQVTNRAMTGNQTTAMIRSAATSTEVRKRKIMNSIRQASYNTDPCVKEFSLSVNEDFTKVQARVLDAPRLKYRQREIQARRGTWQPDLFCTSNELRQWSIVCFNDRTKTAELHTFGQMIVQQGNGIGMRISNPEIIPAMRLMRNREKETIKNLFNKLKNHQIIMVVIPDIKDYYNYVKQMAEIEVGVITQCVKSKNLFRPKLSTVGNILLKMNAKLNGLNHKLNQTPDCLRVPCMIMGADVTHPSPESRGSVPSVAAVTASHDASAFKYNITCRLQQSTQEIITDLANIVLEHLTFFVQTNDRRPERIIFFRDGVSEGQFETVVKSEVQAVRKGCAMLDPSGSYKPKLTFLVVQKRHHTRFFPTNPKDSEDKNFNVPAGTVVDTEITHPTALDFYLVSHASIQGVARPTKYRKLWDDNDMQEDELEELTYHLCHLFARCTRSVSYPAPTYYAHLAAARAKVYCETERIDMRNLDRAQRLLAIKNEVVKGFPMYFV